MPSADPADGTNLCRRPRHGACGSSSTVSTVTADPKISSSKIRMSGGTSASTVAPAATASATSFATRSATPALTSGPITVAATSAANFALNSAAIDRCTRIRSTDMQICPALLNKPKVTAFTA